MTGGNTNRMPNMVAGRSCDGCTMCCKLVSVASISKERLKWCDHCNIGKGCKIYETRPIECRRFYCGYLINEPIGEHWKPSVSRMVLDYEPQANRIVVHVDQGRIDAWRAEPYYSEIKDWARRAADNRGQVVVWQGRDAVVVLPAEEKNLGPVRDDQFILTAERHGSSGVTFDVIVVEKDDPRLQKLGAG